MVIIFYQYYVSASVYGSQGIPNSALQELIQMNKTMYPGAFINNKMENIIDKIYSEAVTGLNEEILKDCDSWYNYVLNLPINQQITYSVVLLNWQVENGGFHQYFFNSYGQFAYLTIKNLKLIGDIQRADLLDTAVHFVNEEYFIENTFRHLIFNREISKIVDFDEVLFEKLNDLDTKYYNIEGPSIHDFLELYLKNS